VDGLSGLVAREHSSGNRIHRGSITKTGNAHLRRVLMEAAWAYQHRPDVSGFLLRRQKALALSEEVKQIAWKAQQRLHSRRKRLTGHRKNKNQVVTTIGRELLGYVWAIAVHMRLNQSSPRPLNEPINVLLDSRADDSAGPNEKENPPTFYVMPNDLHIQPTHLVRGSSRRIMSMRFQPANIRVINRRANSYAVICPAVQFKRSAPPLSRKAGIDFQRSNLRA
jgi:Transposase IS116/IS110/IS902 family